MGHLVMPKDIKFQKWLISTTALIMFMFSAIANGVIIYGIESAIRDKCYSPFSRTYFLEGQKSYFCPSFNGEWIRPEHALMLRAFELGSTLHTISIGIASSASYYLNVGLIMIYLVLFLVGLTMMLLSVLVEILTCKASLQTQKLDQPNIISLSDRLALIVYFNIAPPYIVGFLIYFLLDILELFATINLQVRWINFLM